MASLDWQLGNAGDATLVELLVTSETDARVEIESNLQPVWPPRRQGRPAEGWTGAGFEGVVAADEVLVLGYASPADPVEPPAAIVDTDPVTETPEEPPTPESLVRSLGGAAPPRDAVPTDGGATSVDEYPGGGPDERSTTTAAARQPTSSSSAPGGTTRPQSGGDRPQSGGDRPQSGGDHPQSGGDHPQSGGGRPPPERPPGVAIEAWLDRLERRLDTAERLAAAESVAEARAAVDAAGGINEVCRLCERLADDRDRLGAIETRGDELGQRLAAVDVPLSALERLA